MFYTNIDLFPEKRGEIYGLFFLNKDRRGKDVFLPVSKKIKYIKKGLHKDITITGKNGAPFIEAEANDRMFLFLATERRKNLRSHGLLFALKNAKVKKIGDTYFKNSGTKSVNIVMAEEEDIFRISWGYSPYSLTTYYLVKKGSVYETNNEYNIKDIYEKVGLEIPFRYEENEFSYKEIDASEWKTI